MGYYSTMSTFFVDCYTTNVEQSKKIDKFLSLLDESGVCDFLKKEIKKNEPLEDKGGRPTYNPYNLLAVIIYNFAFNKGTLRDIEDRIKNDLRCIYIMQDQYPTHMTIGNFMNDYIVSNQEKIFSLITKAIFKECKISMDDLYLDGSKFEANANKYKFVWKPTTFHNKLSDKVRQLLSEYDLLRGINKTGIIESKVIAEKIVELNEVVCLGYNVRKLFKHFNGEAKFNYWKAPDNIQIEIFKKPSAKRLSKKASKIKTKSVNQEAKDKYKYAN